MANILIHLIRFFRKLKGVVNSKISDIVNRINIFIFLNFSNPSFIQTLIKDSFFYDLSKDEDSKPDLWFFVRMIRFLLTWVVLVYQTCGSYYYWSDQSKILQYGIFFPGLGLPRELLIAGVISIQLGIFNLASPLKILRKDPDIHFTMAPLRAFVRQPEHPRVISREVVNRVTNEVRPIIGIVRLFALLMPVVFFFISFVSFILHIHEPMTVRTVIIISAWSLHYMKVGEMYSSSSFALFVTMVTLSRLLRASRAESIQIDLSTVVSTSSDSNEFTNACAKKHFLAKLADEVRTVNSVHRFNKCLATIVGLSVTLLLSIATIGLFFCVSNQLSITFVGAIPLIASSLIAFAAIIHVISDIPVQISNAQVTLSRMADKLDWLPDERVRVNRTLSGLSYSNGFSAFGFSPQINRTMMITVSVCFSISLINFYFNQVFLEMVSFILILVLTYR